MYCASYPGVASIENVSELKKVTAGVPPVPQTALIEAVALATGTRVKAVTARVMAATIEVSLLNMDNFRLSEY
jgi:hypothetical protein